MYYTFVLTGLSRLYQNADNTSSLEPPKFCITIVSNFSRLVAAASREIEGNANALFFFGGGEEEGWGVNKVYYAQRGNGELTCLLLTDLGLKCVSSNSSNIAGCNMLFALVVV